jgi:hypothetical protein
LFSSSVPQLIPAVIWGILFKQLIEKKNFRAGFICGLAWQLKKTESFTVSFWAVLER